MAEFALKWTSDFVICDFVAPLVEMRNNFKADWTIWVDTIDQGRFDDTKNSYYGLAGSRQNILSYGIEKVY